MERRGRPQAVARSMRRWYPREWNDATFHPLHKKSRQNDHEPNEESLGCRYWVALTTQTRQRAVQCSLFAVNHEGTNVSTSARREDLAEKESPWPPWYNSVHDQVWTRRFPELKSRHAGKGQRIPVKDRMSYDRQDNGGDEYAEIH